jgi:Fe-S oxidoreductase
VKELSTIFSVLEHLDIRPKVGEEAYCSYIVEATGCTQEFGEVKILCKENFSQLKNDVTLTLCPTCMITLKKRGIRATDHDPCHLGRMLGVFEEPREILQRLGIDIVEMVHNRYFSTCCGGGGGLTMVDDSLSMEISKNRIRDAIDVGVDTIITICPTCETVLGRGALRLLNQTGEDIEVISLWDLLDQSLNG